MSRFLNHSFARLVCGVPTPHQASHHPRLEAWYQTRGRAAAPASPVTPSATPRNQFETAEPPPVWRRQGFFKQEPLSPEERRERMTFARAWLDWILSKGPLPAR